MRKLNVFLPFLVQTLRTMSTEVQTHNYYKLTPLKHGMEAHGIDLKEEIPQNVIDQIKADVIKHRLLVFRDQGIVSGDRHVEISEWFGPCDSTFYKHERSPHPDVFRVSNDRREGCTNVGRTGWHVDGSFQPAPFSFSLYHIWSVPQRGDTGMNMRIIFTTWTLYLFSPLKIGTEFSFTCIGRLQ